MNVKGTEGRRRMEDKIRKWGMVGCGREIMFRKNDDSEMQAKHVMESWINGKACRTARIK